MGSDEWEGLAANPSTQRTRYVHFDMNRCTGTHPPPPKSFLKVISCFYIFLQNIISAKHPPHDPKSSKLCINVNLLKIKKIRCTVVHSNLLTDETDTADRLVTMKCSAGNSWVLLIRVDATHRKSSSRWCTRPHLKNSEQPKKVQIKHSLQIPFPTGISLMHTWEPREVLCHRTSQPPIMPLYHHLSMTSWFRPEMFLTK